jgi:hypothetical protein
MQISYANLIASQQQAVRAPARPMQPAASQSATPAQAAPAFEPIEFKQAAKPAAAPTPAATPAVPTARAPAAAGQIRPGTHIDIKV